jgi:hypothetical protein
VTAIEGRDRIDINVGEGDGIGIRAGRALTDNIHVFAGYTGSNMDLNATHTVPMPTLDEMRAAFFARPEAENWDGPCDLNEDGMINAIDLGLLKLAGDSRIADRVAVGGDMKTWRIGVGYNALITPRVGAYTQVFWDARDLDSDTATFMDETGDIDTHASGFGATVGLRGRVTNNFELAGHVTYTPVGDVNLLAATRAGTISDDTLLGIGGEYWVNDALSIVAEVEGDGDVRSWLFGARYAIGH